MSDGKTSFNPLNISGKNWDSPIKRPRTRTPAMEAVDRMFCDAAKEALKQAGYTALAFLADNPGASKVELAQKLANMSKCRLSALGLIMAVYQEAASKSVLRETAKDLLIRNILAKLPKGWSSQGNVRAVVKVGGWYSEILSFAGDPRLGHYAQQIIRHLAVEHPPAEGWKPQVKNDPLIEELFDRYWPVEPKVAE